MKFAGHLPLSILIVALLAGRFLVACDIYHSADVDDCNSNCAINAAMTPTPTPSPTPHSLRDEVSEAWRTTDCHEGEISAPRVESIHNEQVVWLARDAHTLCAVHFAAVRDVVPEVLIDVAREAVESRSH